MISLNLMKWFIDLFKSNEEEVIDIENDFHHTSARKVESSKGREMETRISYQYPKGEFRFPLVPDDTRETIKHTSSSRERTRRQEQEIEVPIPVSKVKVEPVYKKEKVRIETRGTRPFKPTDIPSPIYGFKGRPEKDKTPLPMENEEKVAGELVTKLADTLITEELVPEVEEIPAAVEPVTEIRRRTSSGRTSNRDRKRTSSGRTSNRDRRRTSSGRTSNRDRKRTSSGRTSNRDRRRTSSSRTSNRDRRRTSSGRTSNRDQKKNQQRSNQ